MTPVQWLTVHKYLRAFYVTIVVTACAVVAYSCVGANQ